MGLRNSSGPHGIDALLGDVFRCMKRDVSWVEPDLTDAARISNAIRSVKSGMSNQGLVEYLSAVIREVADSLERSRARSAIKKICEDHGPESLRAGMDTYSFARILVDLSRICDLEVIEKLSIVNTLPDPDGYFGPKQDPFVLELSGRPAAWAQRSIVFLTSSEPGIASGGFSLRLNGVEKTGDWFSTMKDKIGPMVWRARPGHQRGNMSYEMLPDARPSIIEAVGVLMGLTVTSRTQTRLPLTSKILADKPQDLPLPQEGLRHMRRGVAKVLRNSYDIFPTADELSSFN